MLDIYVDVVDPKEYFTATYKLKGNDLQRAAFGLVLVDKVWVILV